MLYTYFCTHANSNHTYARGTKLPLNRARENYQQVLEIVGISPQNTRRPFIYDPFHKGDKKKTLYVYIYAIVRKAIIFRSIQMRFFLISRILLQDRRTSFNFINTSVHFRALKHQTPVYKHYMMQRRKWFVGCCRRFLRRWRWAS